MHRISLVGLGFIFMHLLLLSACTAEQQAEVLTALAPPAQTVVEQGKNYAGTQSAELVGTAQARLATEAAELKETAKARVATEVAELIDTAQAKLVTEAVKQITLAPTSWIILKGTAGSVLGTQSAIRVPQAETQAAILFKTAQGKLGTEAAVLGPQALTEVASINQTAAAVATQSPPDPSILQTQAAIIQPSLPASQSTQPAPPIATSEIHPTIITYTTIEGDTLARIARQFSLSIDQLLRLNQARYPSLQADPDSLPAGWTLLLAANPAEIYTPGASQAQPPWSSDPQCDLSQVDWLAAPVTCEPFTIEIVSRVKLSLDCISLHNLLGYQQTHTLFKGWLLTDARGVLSYGWVFDRQEKATLIGPAIVFQTSSRTTCNP
jgi:LysM repeat protein